ncbi:MAG: GerMN domain-containing protein [Ilumatobacteraceae bacterium]
MNFLSPETTLPTPPAPVARVGAIIYLIYKDGLLGRPRLIEPTNDPAMVISLLIGAPDPNEAAAGIRSGLSNSPDLIASVGIDGRIIMIDLSKSFADIQGGEQIFILGQIVLSLYAFDDIDGIQFTLDGQAVSVLSPSGEAIDRLVTRSDFAVLLSR